jgi:hypothetical protein
MKAGGKQALVSCLAHSLTLKMFFNYNGVGRFGFSCGEMSVE